MLTPPKTQAPPPPPSINTARQDADRADAFLRRQGRGATLLSTAASRSEGGYGTKALVGQGG